MPIDRKAWDHHHSRAAELLAHRAEAWPERPPELVAGSKEHTAALARLVLDEESTAPARGEVPKAEQILDTTHPIFICGVMKSGTTLVLDLLDGHPLLAALPGDSFLRDAIGTPVTADALPTSLEHWVRRMMNPTGQHPFFVLGAEPAPHVRFVRVMRAAMEDSSHRIAPVAACAAIADALHQMNGTRGLRCLVEKTPDNEHHVDRLLEAFPGARFVHILRDPVDNLRSLLKLHEVRDRAHREEWLRDSIAASHAGAERNTKRLGVDRYCTVRYERLIRDPENVMRALAVWAGLEWCPTLLIPTVFGIHAASNSMWKERQVVGHIATTQPGAL